MTGYSYLQLVELKNGETYNGHLVNCDTWMNIHLREVICTSKVIIGCLLLELVFLFDSETNILLIHALIWCSIGLKWRFLLQDGDRFWRMPECYIRGNTIKYLRVPDEVCSFHIVLKLHQFSSCDLLEVSYIVLQLFESTMFNLINKQVSL